MTDSTLATRWEGLAGSPGGSGGGAISVGLGTWIEMVAVIDAWNVPGGSKGTSSLIHISGLGAIPVDSSNWPRRSGVKSLSCCRRGNKAATSLSHDQNPRIWSDQRRRSKSSDDRTDFLTVNSVYICFLDRFHTFVEKFASAFGFDCTTFQKTVRESVFRGSELYSRGLGAEACEITMHNRDHILNNE
jgi:hypothetical protein